ncbi:hypothetical protein LTR78_003075 [Recurvomyces mirabilis]|uniref:Ribosome maturation protein SDO1/SBDS N-terminal domain-containing protein n=1 Tax=Recurvomyces mirabilis TaxID=574656 RepID=A0AAE0WRT9_9PEZI|nr:hypothetical protein LTR78_003075 [Recurvomyces mirabilis]KAK5157103.1 hypothetical protein LTS14_004621 [Recurvomyces mirabilis]
MHGKGSVTKVHYKGQGGAKSSDHPEDFIVIVESGDAVRKWKHDKTTALTDVVDSFDVFVTHKHGNQGQMDRASKGQLEAEFGSSKDTDVVQKILESGNIIEGSNKESKGVTNVSNGGGVRE